MFQQCIYTNICTYRRDLAMEECLPYPPYELQPWTVPHELCLCLMETEHNMIVTTVVGGMLALTILSCFVALFVWALYPKIIPPMLEHCHGLHGESAAHKGAWHHHWLAGPLSHGPTVPFPILSLPYESYAYTFPSLFPLPFPFPSWLCVGVCICRDISKQKHWYA